MTAVTRHTDGIKVEAVDTDGMWTIYHLADLRGYTKQYDTIRVGRYNNAGDYRVERMTSVGWQHLLAGQTQESTIEWQHEGLDRALRVLYR